DVEGADLVREKEELATQPEAELAELAGIYVKRGLSPELAQQVAVQLTAHDALGTHLRDELGHSEISAARPLQAALASAGSFAVGAALPVLIVLFAPAASLTVAVIASTLVLLSVLGAV